jgi:Skp family chaperone for outer membrane proteins
VYLLVFNCFTLICLGQVPKIGFVNSQQVLYGTAEGKKGLAELEQFMNQQREAFEAKNAELAKLQEDYMTQQRTQDAAALASVERTIQEKEVELRRFREDAQANFNARQNQVLQGISGKVQVLIQEYAQENAFDAIFMRDQNQIYVAPSLDVTEAIIEAYNQRYPGEQAAAAAPASNEP